MAKDTAVGHAKWIGGRKRHVFRRRHLAVAVLAFRQHVLSIFLRIDSIHEILFSLHEVSQVYQKNSKQSGR